MSTTEDYNRELFACRFGGGGELSERERERIAWTARHVPAGTRTVLDVGSGHGGLANRLSETGYAVTAVDLTPATLRHVSGFKVQASAVALPFVDYAFDLVVCAEVIEHLPDGARAACLAEVWRVARRHVLITVPDDEDLAANLVRCDRCGHVFNAWGHIGHFDEGSMRTLYTVPPATQSALRFVEREYWSPLRWIRHQVLRTYGWEENLVCPGCRNDQILAPKRSLPVKLLDRVNHHLGRRRRAGWLLAVWARHALLTAEPQQRPGTNEKIRTAERPIG